MAFSRRHSCSGRGVPQATLDYLECALKDLQSQVTALRAEELPPTQLPTKPDITELLAFFDPLRTTNVVEPGVEESESTEIRASAQTSAAVHGDTTSAEDAEPQNFET